MGIPAPSPHAWIVPESRFLPPKSGRSGCGAAVQDLVDAKSALGAGSADRGARGLLADLAGSAGTTGLGPLGRGEAGDPLPQRAALAGPARPRRSSDTTSAPSSTSSGRATEMKAERDLTRELGVDFVNLPMPGDGLGEEWQFREVLKILDDPDRRPGAGPLRPGDLPDRGRRGLLSLRTRRMDARGRGGGAARDRRIIMAWSRATSMPW